MPGWRPVTDTDSPDAFIHPVFHAAKNMPFLFAEKKPAKIKNQKSGK